MKVSQQAREAAREWIAEHGGCCPIALSRAFQRTIDAGREMCIEAALSEIDTWLNIPERGAMKRKIAAAIRSKP